MRVPRIHVATELAPGSRVDLPATTAHHLLRVLRLRQGAAVQLFNGEAGDWHGRLAVTGKRSAAVDVDDFVARDAESPLALTLVQGLSRGQRMDYTLEKSVELGVSRIQPVVMARSQAVPRGERIERKMAHWAGVIAAAAAQSGRTRLPALAPLVDIDTWLEARDTDAEPMLLLDPTADAGPGDLAEVAGAATLLAGPEGGFSPAERRALDAAGATGMRLGPRVLRTETAAVAALAVLQARFGNL